MKKITTRILLTVISAIIVLNSTPVTAQKKIGESVITVGAGLSLIGISGSISNNNAQEGEGYKASPTFSGQYDIGLADFFSLGLAATYQTFTSTYQYTIVNSYGNTVVAGKSYKDKLTRTNYGLRAMFHFGEREKIDMYAGPRIGYTIWNVSTNNTDSAYVVRDHQPWAIKTSSKFGLGYTVQALYGMRFFFNEFIGMNFEISIGAPSFLTLGINGKF